MAKQAEILDQLLDGKKKKSGRERPIQPLSLIPSASSGLSLAASAYPPWPPLILT